MFVGFSDAALNKSEKIEKLILEDDFPRDKLQNSSRSLYLFVQRCLEKDPDDRAQLSELLREGWLAESK